jgi:hypothetical protein
VPKVTRLSTYCGGGDTGRPLVAGTLLGYRTWRPARRWTRVPEGALPLTAVTRRHIIWTPTLRACCSPPWIAPRHREAVVPPDHHAPFAGCRCGIYAWYQPDDTGILHAGVFGAVEASGIILMGDRGFRSERARIVGVVTRNRRVAAACDEAGIDVYRHRRDLLRDHPPHDIGTLLGEPVAHEPDVGE